MKINWHWLIPLALLQSQNAWPEIVTDGSLTGKVESLPGPVFNITPDIGKTVGSNLFHSFSQFTINKGETANFQAPPVIDNIFTRVTGGTASTINGTLNSTSTASLWLINPAGWIIGKDAALNVNGALHFTTANGLGFKDGGVFLADPASKSTLTVSTPIDYQFTQDKQAAITIDSKDIVVETGKDVSLVGGDINLQNSRIIAQSGRIMLGSNSGVGRWQENAAGLSQLSGNRGNITIAQNTQATLLKPTLTVNGNTVSDSTATTGGGQIQLIGNQINLKNGLLSALALDEQKGGSISIDGTHTTLTSTSINTRVQGEQDAGSISIKGVDLTLTGIGQTGSLITADSAFGSTGKSGSISIALTGALNMDHLSSISSKLLGSGNGGDLLIRSHTINLDQLSSFSVATNSNGNAGKIDVQSNALKLDRNSFIASSADQKAGNAGNINIASNDISLQNYSVITSQSGRLSKGQAGNITLRGLDASNYNTLHLQQSKITTSLLGNTGNGGDIKVDTGILILNGGFIQANSAAKGGIGGTVTVNAKKSMFSNDQLLIGGDEAHNFDQQPNFNVIQAAAKDGTSGNVTVSPVGLYLSGQLAKVDAIFVNNKAIANDPCSVNRGEETSSLIQLGNGGLPPNASDAVSLPMQRYLQNANKALHTSALEIPLQLALHLPSHLCAKDNS